MNLSLKYQALILAVAAITSFSFGRYSAPKIPDTHTVTDVKVDEKKDILNDDHKKTVIVKTPDGTTTTTITDDDVVKTNDLVDTDKHTDATVTAPKTSTLNLSALSGVEYSGPNAFKPFYGLSVTKQLVGPVTIGVWGLTNSTIGVSIGLNF